MAELTRIEKLREKWLHSRYPPDRKDFVFRWFVFRKPMSPDEKFPTEWVGPDD